MQSVQVRDGIAFRCPLCEWMNVVAKIGKVGRQTLPSGWHRCQHCEFELTVAQQRFAAPYQKLGGAVLPAWLYTCPGCGNESSTSVTIYRGDGLADPPKLVKCRHCAATLATLIRCAATDCD